jgi:hypothetical protein
MRWCHDELTLDEMLSDPLIDVLMRADGVDRERLERDFARIFDEREQHAAAE